LTSFLFTSINFLHLSPEPASTGEFKAFQLGLMASTYLFPLAKSVEFLCGLSFITGKFTTLANIFPVTLNILFINYYLTPDNLPSAHDFVFVFIFDIGKIIRTIQNGLIPITSK
jgi:uncharacterized membrane protein YphA (DoxX/SURF4 family)